jgi:hypothetical protein
MTPSDFRRLALSFPETEERAHMDHPDFRVAGKIFATLVYPEDGWAMVKLTPIEQEIFIKAHGLQPLRGCLGTPRRHQRPPEGRQEAYVAPRPRRRLAPRRPQNIDPSI